MQHLSLSVLVVVVVGCIVTAQETGENQQVYNYFPYYGPNARFFITSTTTTTSVTTSTSTIVCTSSVYAVGGASYAGIVAACSGRRRRGIQFEEDDNEQFSISPSAVQGVEATASPIREARAADPHYLIMSPFGYYPQEIQPGFYGPAVPSPYYNPYAAQPLPGNRIFLSTILQAALPTFLKQTSTVTATSTVFTVTTSRSVPVCTPIPAVLQCV